MLTATDSGPIAAAIQTANQPMIAPPAPSQALDPAIQTAFYPIITPVLEPGMTGYGGLATLDGNTLGQGGYTDPAGVTHSYASNPTFTAAVAAAQLGQESPPPGPPASIAQLAALPARLPAFPAAADPLVRYDPRPAARLPDMPGAAGVAPVGGSPVASPVHPIRGVGAVLVGVPIVSGRPLPSSRGGAGDARGAFGSLVSGLVGHRLPRHLHGVTRTPLTP